MIPENPEGFLHLVRRVAEMCAGALELLGVAIIMAVAIWATGYVLLMVARRRGGAEIFKAYRHKLARGILLGLEPLVAADIIHTVAIDLTLRTVAVLAIVVVIRTFLSFTLELEMSGRWPWQKKTEAEG